MFAVSYLDFGNFTKIEHCIDTGDARPIKQWMRRMHGVFKGKEEGHLEKGSKPTLFNHHSLIGRLHRYWSERRIGVFGGVSTTGH